MKKIILIMLFMLSLCFFNTYADSVSINNESKISNNMYKLYKKAIISRNQIKKDYKDGDKINKKIERYFINLYFRNDRKDILNDIEKNILEKIKKYNSKNLTFNEKKELNLLQNLYYRALIELNK